MSGFISYPYVVSVVAAGTVGGEFLANETDAMGIDFTYHTDVTKQLYISDLTTPANNYNGTAQGKLTYTSPSIKLCRQSDGVWRYGSHNLYLASAVPANQAVTVVSGRTYDIVITGSVSITWSSAFVGTTTAGTTSITAASTSLIGGSTSGSGTVAIYHTPSVGNYLATAGTAVYDLPYEWDAALASQGILIEEARTNLLPRSQDFATSWTLENATRSSNAATAPDGTTTADTLTASAGNSNHDIYWAPTIGSSGGTPYAFSLFVKKGTSRYVHLNVNATSTDYICAVFDLDGGGTTATQTGTGATGTIVSTSQAADTNSWYRLTVVGSLSGGGAIPAVGIPGAATGNTIGNFGNITWSAAGTETVHLWQYQAEAGSFPTSPIHTIATTVTRATDQISLPISSFPYSQTVGTQVAKASTIVATASVLHRIAELNDGSNQITLRRTNATNTLNGIIGGDGSATTAGTISANTDFKGGMAWQSNDLAVCLDNGTVATDASVTVPGPLTVLQFGYSLTAAREWNGYIKQYTYLKRRATDGELQTRTT